MKKRENQKRVICFNVILALVSITIIILTFSLISAADVAYIYKSKAKIDQNVINVFNEMNLTVEIINERNLSQNFSRFKFIFVGNEKFSNYKKIPVNDFNSVIMNNYRGYQWGITDRDGISKLSRSKPLSIIKNGHIIQVYNVSLYNKKSISLPYLYLAKNNKNKLMEKIAGVYTGDGNDKGDVISFLKAGSQLTNKKISKGNICFYGIVESKYWTSEARQLFKESVSSVLITCRLNSDCPKDTNGNKYCINNSVYQDISHYSCANPGTAASICIAEIQRTLINNCSFGQLCNNGQCISQNCNNDNDCGVDGFIGDKFCQNNSVFNNYATYTCNSPGEINSSCTISSTPILNISCLSTQMCSGAICYNISCFSNSNCNDNNNYTSDKCNNPGTINASCSHSNISCLNNSDCGTGRFIGNLFCGNNLTNIMGTFVNYSCVGAGTPSSYCANITYPLLNSTCSNNLYCYSGICSNISCFDDDDCGTNAFDNNTLMCQNNHVFGNYTTHTCNNAGTSQSNCSYTTNFITKQNCLFGCNNSNCLVHDVGLVNFSNAVNKIKIVNSSNSSDVILSDPAVLNCNQSYQFIIKAGNNGDFAENITYYGNIGNISVNHTKTDNLLPNAMTIEKVRTINVALTSGNYNLTITANIFNDNNPLDNIAIRSITVNC